MPKPPPHDPDNPPIGRPRRGTPNRDIKYACDVCGREVGRNNLVAKRVSFRNLGAGAADLKNRTVAWLCIVANGAQPSCRDQDEDWNRPPRSTSPGMKDVMGGKS